MDDQRAIEGTRVKHRAAVVAVLALAAALLLPTAARSVAAATPTNPPLPPPSYTATVNQFPVPGGPYLTRITQGPDGNSWFVDGNGRIGKITATGSVTMYSIPLPTNATYVQPMDIVAGPDGNLWFTSGYNPVPFIGKISTSGDVQEYPLPTTACPMPYGITVGPGGNLWFTDDCMSTIGEMTTAGTLVTQFSVPYGSNGPMYIAAGADGNLYYTTGDLVGQATPGGSVVTIAAHSNTPDGYPGTEEITRGPDGNVWFTDLYGNQINRLTPRLVLTQFPVPTSSSQPEGITVGPDGNLWFTEYMGNRVGRVTTAGVITEIHLPTVFSLPYGITTGGDGKLWFTEQNTGDVASLDPASLTPPPGPCLTVTQDLTLTHDVGPCQGDGILVTGSNLTLNLGNHNVLGAQRHLGDFAGIHIMGSNVKVIGGGTNMAEVTGFDAGVLIHEGSSGNTVQNLNIHDNLGIPDASSFLGDGVVVMHSANNRISNNHIVGNGSYDGIGILGLDSNNNVIQNNLIQGNTDNGAGFFAPGAATGIIINPMLEIENPRRGESVSGNNVINNTVIGNTNTGISNMSNVGGLIEGNDVENNGLTGNYPANGIGTQHLMMAQPDTNDTIQLNTVKHNGSNGIEVDSDSNHITRNVSTDNAQVFSWGYDLYDSHFWFTPDTPCDSNVWYGNTWGSAGYDAPCVTAGGSGPNPPPGQTHPPQSPPPHVSPSDWAPPRGHVAQLDQSQPFMRGKEGAPS